MCDIYSALFPKAVELHMVLADPRLRNLHQKRNLIVHKRGIVDQQYLESTGDKAKSVPPSGLNRAKWKTCLMPLSPLGQKLSARSQQQSSAFADATVILIAGSESATGHPRHIPRPRRRLGLESVCSKRHSPSDWRCAFSEQVQGRVPYALT